MILRKETGKSQNTHNLAIAGDKHTCMRSTAMTSIKELICSLGYREEASKSESKASII